MKQCLPPPLFPLPAQPAARPAGTAGRLVLPALLLLFTLLALLPGPVVAQDLKTVQGTVRGATDKSPLPGVTITIKGANNGTVSGADGKYSLQAKSTDVLVFSFIGFKNQEASVGNRTTIEVTLSEDASELNEVVVIGYGAVQKMDLTGAVGQVKMGEMVKAPVASFAEALAGRVAGVRVASGDGQPGGGVNIVIRGAGSLTQSTAPLYVIDGFPVENIDPATLNPEDIESMSILKDASSTAIYGSRASNGVILIQTKRGKAGKPVINFSSSIGFQKNRRKMEMMSPYEFVKYNLEQFGDRATVAQYLSGDKTLESYRDMEGIDWQDQVFRTGAVKIHNLAMRGGNEQTRYALSGSVYDQDGVVINTGLKRYTGRITLDQTINERLKAGITGNFSHVSSFGQPLSVSPFTSVSSYVLFRTWVYRPIAPDQTGEDLLSEEVDAEAVTTSDFRINPFLDLDNQHQVENTNLFESNGFFTYDILKNLTLKVTGGIRRNSIRQDKFYNSKTSQGSPFNPGNNNGVNGSVRYINQNSWSNENMLTYKTTFNQDHTLTALGLVSFNKFTRNDHGYAGRLLPNESLGMDGLDQGISFNPVSFTTGNTLVSYTGRLDYNYKSKYILTGTFRADGSSKFAHKWGYFPAAAFAWNMTREAFFADRLPAISNSKLRASYGNIGNNRVGDYERYASLDQVLNGYSFNNQTPTDAAIIGSVANEDLRWETTTSMDLGYELGLFKNRLGLELDFYRKHTKDLLLNADLPPSMGYGSAFKNIGELKNEGLEFTLNTVNVDGASFNWSSSFNISFNKNEILALERGALNRADKVGGFESQFNIPLYITEIGKPAGMMYGVIWDGNYQYADFDNPSPGVYILKNSVPTNGNSRNSIQPGDIKYRDLNADGVVNNFDMTVIGRGQPIHTGGLTNNFSYKGLSLNVFLQWSYGNDIYNANRLSLEGNSNARINVNQFASYADRWTPENQTNRNYRAGGQGPVGRYSSRVVEDGSFLRLKTLSLDYALPQRFLPKQISTVSLNVSAQNLMTWTQYSGLDPEVSVRHQVLAPGFDFSAYPQAQTLVFGVKAAF